MSTTPQPENKLKKLLAEKGWSYQDLYNHMKKENIPTITVDALSKMGNQNRPILASMRSRKAYPCTLERLCMALNCKSSDLLDY